MEIKSLEQREALALLDIHEAIKSIDLNKIQPQITNNITDDEGNTYTEEEPYIDPVEQSLYKKNQGPSKYVANWIQSHPNIVVNMCLGSASLLKRIITCIKECVTQSELNFQFSKDDIIVQALGPSNV